MIRKLLVANRGEIAVRVMRTARERGIRTVAVHSTEDARAMHVGLADEAVELGAAEPSASYLNIEAILSAAVQTGADAIHPGYGFLSERPEFAEACAANGILFVGPSAASMRLLGSKSAAKKLAVDNGVPIVPGHFEPGATLVEMARAAESIGYPVMLKASAGGGGRGMRIVHDPTDFARLFELASEEAVKAFGDGSMMVEKLVERPRHIEVQLLADTHGNVACLFERECSIQRRHQKLVEESPSPFGMEEIWPEMRTAAEKLARAARYVGAGTVEFIVDTATGKFYFLEVNTRLQVEHPVTELIAGVDLVGWQLAVAEGERLQLSDSLMAGERTAIVGHAIEARIVAEDPEAGFLPSVGKLLAWAEPRSPGVRVDTGYNSGGQVSRYYDSLLAKVIAHGETRAVAIERLKSALLDFHVIGVKTNIGFILDVVSHPDFVAGDIDTGFLEREFGNWSPGPIPTELGAIVEGAVPSGESGSLTPVGAWSLADSFRNARS